MAEKNLSQRLLIILAVIAIGFVFLWPPQQKLRPGLDIAGGTSLIYEIDDTGVRTDTDLADRVKVHLQKRVDPAGVYGLVWRVHGRNRLEVQMPLPPENARERRQAYADALRDLFATEIRRGEIFTALDNPPEQRDEALRQLARRNADAALEKLAQYDPTAQEDPLSSTLNTLARAIKRGDAELDVDELREAIEAGIERRNALLLDVADRYEARRAAQQALDALPATQPADEAAPERQELEDELRDARELFEEAVDGVLASNLNRRRFQDVLELDEGSRTRMESLRHVIDEHPDLVVKIARVVDTYRTFRSERRYLDGPADLKRLLQGAGKLEFRILATPNPDNPTLYDRYRRQLKEGQERVPNDPYGWFKIDNAMQFFNLNSPAELAEFDHEAMTSYVVGKLGEDYYVLAKLGEQDGLLRTKDSRWKLNRAIIDRDESGRWCVRFFLDPIGGSRFDRLTRNNIGEPLCILVDDIAYSAPTIQSVISRSGQITGEFSLDKVNYLVQTMEGGTLPGRLKDTPLSERTVGSSLGEANRDAAVRAGLIGACAVILLMAIYYWICGGIAVVALSMNVFLVCAALAMLGARITLDGIAGIILAVGMAVDANVLIYERMREEKDRGASLRMIIKNGYDKALSTILDSNITTLLTCVIIYYVGSEEVKGFGLTLGWGIVLNLFTSIFVTRTLFGVLLKYNIIKDIGMLRIIGVPTIDWYAKRKYFIPLSLIIVIGGMSLLIGRGADVFDVEFRGGVAAEIELSDQGIADDLNDRSIHQRIETFANELGTEAAPKLAEARIEEIPGEIGVYRVSAEGLSSGLLAAMIAEPLEETNLLERGGVQLEPERGTVRLVVKPEATADQVTETIHGLAKPLASDADNLARASINAVLGEEQRGRVWNVTTTVTNTKLVEHALAESLGENMRVQPSIQYVFEGEGERPYPITSRQLRAVVPDLPEGANADLTNYLGGAAMYFTELDPPRSTQAIRDRLENMHFQPDFQDLPQRDFTVVGVQPVEGQVDDAGNEVYRSIVVATVDPDLRYSVNPDAWWTDFARPELDLVKTALGSEQTLRKVMQFKPQIASRSVQQATVALLLAWGMIIGYVWIRFGRPIYGVSGVVALIHDALIALAFVGFSGGLASLNHWIPDLFLVTDFKIDMTIVAAMLTIIGYSINDTIVVFDRIRETRGRLGVVTPEIINSSINQTLSRTLMTSITTLLILLIMYIFGGPSIRGFNFCMMVGIITGSYSSIAVASPLLMARVGRWGATAPR